MAVLNVRPLMAGRSFEGAGVQEVWNPARPDDVVGRCPTAGPEDVERAVQAAHVAGQEWARVPVAERSHLLSGAVDRLAASGVDRAECYVRENGKTLAEAAGELSNLPDRLRLVLGWADRLADETLPASTGRVVLSRRPYGVTACIAPWNAPVTQAVPQVVSALLAGNSVVVKPALSCPLTLMVTLDLLAGNLPPGLVNTVPGEVEDVGRPLIEHPLTRKIAFTGSTASGRQVMQSAARTVKSVSLELGGNDPAVVLADADLDATAAALVGSVFRMAGQVCMAVKRIYVEDAVHDAFVEAFAAAMDRIVVGDGLDPQVTMGPLHTKAAKARVEQLLIQAAAAGARVQERGRVADGSDPSGYFLLPRLVTNIPASCDLVVEEQFGPAIPVVRCRDAAAAVVLANATEYGLAGSVWTSDVDRGEELARQLEVGTAFVNMHGTQSVNRENVPYGGVKQSGLGRKAGWEGITEYTELQTLVRP